MLSSRLERGIFSAGRHHIGKVMHTDSADILSAWEESRRRWVESIKYPFQSADVSALIFCQKKQQYNNNISTLVVLFKYKRKRPSREGLEAL